MSRAVALPPIVALAILFVVLSNDREAGTVRARTVHKSSADVWIAPGELPGYTGWARPKYTLAGFFSGNVPSKVDVGSAMTFDIHCIGHVDCAREKYFYVRAYGPAVLTGTVSKLKQGKYRVEINPMDPGLYTVEVVLAFSSPPDLSSFPLLSDSPPLYEGYLLAGFPQSTKVIGRSVSTRSNICGLEHLLLRGYEMHQARWRPQSSNRDASNFDGNEPTGVSLDKYQSSENSLGITMDYEFEECRLPSLKEVRLEEPHQFVIIGDSTMRIQIDRLEQWVKESGVQHDIIFIELYGGWWRCKKYGPIVVNRLLQLHQSRFVPERRIIIANSGLHDIHRLCGDEWAGDRATYLSESQLSMSCQDIYGQGIQELTELVHNTPAAVRLFQTTTAGWPKYGNYGVQWDPRYGQSMPLDAASFVHTFNGVAVGVVAGKLSIVDGFWVSLSRPDNREIDKQSGIGPKLSHPGSEVVQTMVRLWLSTAVELLSK